MAGRLSLNGIWDLTWAEGSPLVPPGPYVQPTVRARRMMPARVPAPIHTVLQEAGLLEDPNIGLNSLRARWVEEQFWVYRLAVQVPEDAARESAWLRFGRLEYEAEVFVNGVSVGTHANAHRPARLEVTGKLKPGENQLAVLISGGLHSLCDKPVLDYDRADISKLVKRPWQRRPQYQSGWDWNARLGNIGILGDVALEWSAAPVLEEVAVCAVPSANLGQAVFHVRATVVNPAAVPVEGVLRAVLRETGQEVRQAVSLPKGESLQALTFVVKEPRLWWPRPHGEPFLYTVEVTFEAGGQSVSVSRRTGVRRVEVDQSPHPVAGRYFTVRVNNRPVFLKGGNWVPADLLYSTVDAARYRQLVELAVGANFNALRVWGGGLFAEQAFCDACDELGVLIWHDFLFACAKYPGDDPAFAAEVRREVSWAVRDLAHHPSLIVWCGNNEIEWGDWGWGYDSFGRTHPHYALFHHDIPQIVAAENPAVFYWPSSPFSPEYRHPNDPTIGDQHPWTVSIGQSGADWWEYRTYVDRFPNEGGVLGASSPATLRQFLPAGEQALLSPSWEHHDNPFACLPRQPGEMGRAYETVKLWLDRDPLALSLDDYAFCSALLQAEALPEYIANYRRRMYSSSSAIFWMYNDSWPVTHGWTIVDYYRRQKLAYHPVRRAFQPVTVVVAEEADQVTVTGINDTPAAWSGRLRFGVFRLQGGLLGSAFARDESRDVEVPANCAAVLARFPRADWESVGFARSGAFAVLEQAGETVAQHRLFVRRFHELEFAAPEIRTSLRKGVLTLTADVFVWGVCLDVDGETPLADNCVDLLPGVPYRIPWPAAAGRPRVVRIGSRDALKPRA